MHLDQLSVAIYVSLIEPHQYVDGALHGGFGEPCVSHPVAAVGLAQPIDRVDPDTGDGFGVLVCHRLNLHSALGGEHAQVLLGRTIKSE